MCRISQRSVSLLVCSSSQGASLTGNQQHQLTTHLVWVSHHEQFAVWSCDLPHQLKLAQVGVLALINQHMAPAPVKLSTDLQDGSTALLMCLPPMYSAWKMLS
jgi:hypothetical protein